MKQEQSREQPINRMAEKPDLEGLRQTYAQPSPWELRWERVKAIATNRTFLTLLLAAAIFAALGFGYLQLN